MLCVLVVVVIETGVERKNAKTVRRQRGYQDEKKKDKEKTVDYRWSNGC